MASYKDDKVFKKLVEIVNNLTTYFTKSRKHGSLQKEQRQRRKFNKGHIKKNSDKWKKYAKGRRYSHTKYDKVNKRRDYKNSLKDTRKERKPRRRMSRRFKYNPPLQTVHEEDSRVETSPIHIETPTTAAATDNTRMLKPTVSPYGFSV